jgi:glycyl-tRNA synthetase beta chain
MVGEFPELQGVMGGYYAAAQGEDPRIAAAIRDHYKPAGQGDEVPTDPVTVAVSLADKLDSLFAFFLMGERPSGSKDPFALRRASLGCISLLTQNQLRAPLMGIAFEWLRTAIGFPEKSDSEGRLITTFLRENLIIRIMKFGRREFEPLLSIDSHSDINGVLVSCSSRFRELIENYFEELESFFADRLKVQQREAGVRHDLIDAVFALGGEDDLVRLLARVKALQAFIGTEDGANLLTGYRRAANILKKEGWDQPEPQRDRHPGLDPGSRSPSDEEEAGSRLGGRGDVAGNGRQELPYTPEPEEAALIAALDTAAPAAAEAVARENFEAAMAALATLRAPIDAFFDKVTVNDADPAKRAARLALLTRIRDAVHGVADFSKIEG